MPFEIVLKNQLFFGLPTEEIKNALDLFDGLTQKYTKGTMIAHGTKLKRFGLVLSGTVQVSFTDIDGNLVLMASVASGDTFGESLCWLGVEEIPVIITAFEDSEVLWLSPDVFRRQNLSPLGNDLRNRFVSMLASKALAMNDRVQVLSKQTLRKKIVTYLSQESNRKGSKTFSIPFDRETLALYLGVNRSALSRELSQMQKEGIVEFYRNTFKILK